MDKKLRIEIKKHLLDDPLFLKQCGLAKREIFVNGDCRPMDELKATYGEEIVKVGLGLNQARYKRVMRVKERIGSYVESGYTYFVTLTFKNEKLERTKEDTRRQAVRRFLSKLALAYVANIDYGDKVKNPHSNEREHYHALIYTDKDRNALKTALNELWRDKWGIYKLEKVGYTPEDKERTAKYVAKLTNHAMKVDGKGKRIIYSRNKDKCSLPPMWLFDEE